MTEHPHFCDCDGCLNRGGGLKLPGAGVVRPDPSFDPTAPDESWGGIMVPGYASQTEAGLRLEHEHREQARAVAASKRRDAARRAA